MLRLENIRIDGNIAYADYYPEDSTEHGDVSVDLTRQEFISYSMVEGYGMSYPGHAMWKLIELAKEIVIPQTITVAWY